MQAIKLTPKKVALAIGVSESSMKRWCDRGLIDFHTTAGGHRRLSQASVISFLRAGKHSLLKSELIGLPEDIRPEERNLDTARADFLNAIVDGNEAQARKIVYELFLVGKSIAAIGDEIISPTFEKIGRQWDCGQLEIYRERRACEITLRVLSELRPMLPVAPENAPVAIGGAPGGDEYSLPTMLVEMVFCEAGWRSQSLGSNLPFATLAAAAREQAPRLFWLSVSAIHDQQQFLADFEQFRNLLPTDTLLAVGGRALNEPVRQHMRYSAYGDTLKQLESLAQTLKTQTVPRVSNGVVTNY